MKKMLRSRLSLPPAHRPLEPFVMVATSFSPITAHLMSGALERFGIDCVLSNEIIGAVDPSVSNLGGGVHMMVRQSDQA